MATKQLVETRIWSDNWFSELSNDCKLLFLYLLTNKDINPAGMYQVNLKVLQAFTGLTKLEDKLLKLSPAIQYDKNNKIIWIVNYANKNSRGKKIEKSVLNTLDDYSKSFLVGEFCKKYKETYNFDTLSGLPEYSIPDYGIGSNDNDNDNENDNDNDNDNENENEKPKFDFEKLYASYPKKEGRKKGLGILKRNIKTQDKFDDLKKALQNYIAKLQIEKTEYKYIKQFSTFANCWEDYVEAIAIPPAPENNQAMSEDPDCIAGYVNPFRVRRLREEARNNI